MLTMSQSCSVAWSLGPPEDTRLIQKWWFLGVAQIRGLRSLRFITSKNKDQLVPFYSSWARE